MTAQPESRLTVAGALARLARTDGATWITLFEHGSDDFATWVVFYGPKGGEQPQPT